MKRIGGLWPKLTSFENLHRAAHNAALGKKGRSDVAAFMLDLENELARLRRELLSEEYEPGSYRTFVIREPKPRQISAAPFRDLVVHHALTQVLEPVFEPKFSSACYACRKGLGTHKAIRAAREAVLRHHYVLKCDIRKYFASIDHEILNGLLARAVKCTQTLRLAERIIAGSNPQEETITYFPGDDLFTPFGRRRGLPLGNQTSQFFANVYLNPLDQLVTRKLRCGPYIRYVDDFLVFGDDKPSLAFLKRKIEEQLSALRLRLHEGKSRLYRTCDGVTFLGWVLFPGHARLARQNVVRFRRRLRGLSAMFEQGAIPWEEVKLRVQAWIAHASHGQTYRLRDQIFEETTFKWIAARTARRELEQQLEEPAGVEP
ncbi:MAG: RNA-dependent DNA polymerase [Bryobacteraceae bacterium]|nr:RNA-dependent DNA polymerase [Bryobacteraceae bacterium]